MAKLAMTLLVLVMTISIGSGRVLLQQERAVPPASNVSLPIPRFTYYLGSLAPGPSSSLLGQLGALVPASAPISSAVDQVLVVGRKLQQMIFTPAPAPSMLAPAAAPSSLATPVLPATPDDAACIPLVSLLPSTFASFGNSLGLQSGLTNLPSDNYSLVVPSNEALAAAATTLSAIASDSIAMERVVGQALIQGKNLVLTDGEVLTTRAGGSPLTVGKDSAGVVTLKSSFPSSAKLLSTQKTCTLDLFIVDGILLPTGLMASSQG